MSWFQEVLQAVFLFALAFVVIPVGIFTADLLKDYYRKEEYKNDMGRNSRGHSGRQG